MKTPATNSTYPTRSISEAKRRGIVFQRQFCGKSSASGGFQIIPIAIGNGKIPAFAKRQNVIDHSMTTQTTDIKREFKTPLGVVRCGLICNRQDGSIERKKYENGSSEIFNTDGHKIEIVSFKIRVPLYNGDNLADSCGWIFRIEKTADIDEKLETYCLLDKINDEITFDTATGEHLDAIQADSNKWTLHIGTEDGEILNSRAENDDWFPPRLKNKVDFYQSITKMNQNGFVTKIPDLNKGEKIHIQYLTAYDKRDEQKVNTWLAVDEFKRKLENWIGIW